MKKKRLKWYEKLKLERLEYNTENGGREMACDEGSAASAAGIFSKECLSGGSARIDYVCTSGPNNNSWALRCASGTDTIYCNYCISGIAVHGGTGACSDGTIIVPYSYCSKGSAAGT